MYCAVGLGTVVGVAATRTARALLPADIHRLIVRKPQYQNWHIEYSLCLHTANGLRLRLH